MTFEHLLSAERWHSYALPEDLEDDHEQVFRRYLWNVQLCEALYPCLHFFEIGLRNQIDRAVSAHLGAQWLQDEQILRSPSDRQAIASVLQSLSQQGKHVTHGRLIAELPLGFWVKLFRKGPYRTTLWPYCIVGVFPHMKENRNPRFVYEQLETLRKLRNRVFHHEPIWRDTQLGQKHETLLTVLGWMSTDLAAMARQIDRFSDVFLTRLPS